MDPAQWLADYRERLERTAPDARAASATATSPRGEVSVTVNAGGLLDDATLTPAARRLETDALSVLIVATARKAQRLATARTAEVLSGHLPPDHDEPTLTPSTTEELA